MESPMASAPGSPPCSQQPPELDDLAVIDDLLKQALLTEEQHAIAVAQAKMGNAQVTAALTFYERNRLRTAVMLSKVGKANDGNGDR